jgi:hypothetical protein
MRSQADSSDDTPGSAVAFTSDLGDAQIIEGEPGRKELILTGRVSLADTDRDPDSWMDPEVEEQRMRATPENTMETLYWAWGRWIWWCGRTGRDHLNVHPNSVRQYIKDHWEWRYPADHPNPALAGQRRGRRGQPYSWRTVETAVYCMVSVLTRLGYRNPMEDPKVADQLAAYKEDFARHRYRTDESDPMTHDMSCTLARSFDLSRPTGLRNAALMRLRLDMGSRKTELMLVHGDDLQWLDVHTVLITLRRTKGRQERTVAVEALPELVWDEKDEVARCFCGCGLWSERPRPPMDWDVDPVELLRRYVKLRMEQDGWDGTGPLWVEAWQRGPHRGKLRNGVQLEVDAFDVIFNRAVQATEIDRDPVTGKRRLHITPHSDRVGMITASVDAGLPLEKVVKRTGHSPASRAIHKYYRSGRQLGDDNAGTLLRTRELERRSASAVPASGVTRVAKAGGKKAGQSGGQRAGGGKGGESRGAGAAG